VSRCTSFVQCDTDIDRRLSFGALTNRYVSSTERPEADARTDLSQGAAANAQPEDGRTVHALSAGSRPGAHPAEGRPRSLQGGHGDLPTQAGNMGGGSAGGN